MIVAPGIKPGRCSTPVSFLDIYPTLVELAGLEPNMDLDGKSIVPLMTNPEAVWERPALNYAWKRQPQPSNQTMALYTLS